MPELKHHFRRGRMNKDLDERLLPNGEYRDAQNVEVVTSEGSDVGSIQNVLGTVLKKGRLYDENTQILTEWSADSNLFDLIDPTCIGSFVDTQNDNIYWFIHYSFLNDSNNAIIKGSAVVEYDNNTGVIQPVLVDVSNILKFSSDYLITGINAIDGLLLWTDNQTEPKRINIKKFKEGTVVGSDQFKVQTKYLGATGSNFTEKDITVIKLSPNIKPELSLSASKKTGAGTGNQPITVKSPIITFKSSDGDDGVVLSTGTSLTLNFPVAITYTKGDILKLSYTDTNSIEGDINYEILLQVDTVANNSVIAIIQVIPNEVPYGANLPWECVLVEGDPLFENKFVRFSYRWKYIDGEYSTFSPFSNIAFLPSKFKYKSSDGYNVGMINTTRQIEIQALETPPVGVIEVDLLYKESNNNNVYIVDRIKTEDLSTEFPYQIKSEIVGDVVESNQMLRPWDNVPLKAKSQEISSNRILYGNYTQGYNIENNRLPDVVTTVNSSDITTIEVPERSIKSERTYQVGVVYLDPYSRETPVFSKKQAAVTVGRSYANKVNTLSCILKNNAPDFATHFKYFVKETSSEYYNIALDRYYLAEDGNVWLSFPSSERNKVSENDYLILKKAHDNNVFIHIAEDTDVNQAKYKILDIKNEVPDFISLELKSISIANVQCVVLNPNTSNAALSNEPIPNSVFFKFIGPTATDDPSFYDSFSSDSEIVITTIDNAGNDVGSTKRYKLSKGGPTGKKVELSSKDYIEYEITLRESIKETDADILLNSYFIQANNATEFKIEVLEKQNKDKSEFSGRFFAKINRNNIFDTHIIETFPAVETDYVSIRKTNVLENALNDPNGQRSNQNDSRSDFCWQDTVVWNKFDTKGVEHPELNSKSFTIYLAGVAISNEKVDKDDLYEDVVTHPFSKDLRTTGTLLRFENLRGDIGKSVYKIITSKTTTEFRSDKNAIKKRTGGRRRKFEITIKKVSADSSDKGDGYDDGFNFDVTDVNSEKSRIAKIHTLRKILQTDFLDGNDISSDNPAIFEVEPKESIDLDIYNEVGSALPIVKTGLKVTGTGIASNCIIQFYDTINNTVILSSNTTGSISTGTVLTMTDPKGIYSFKVTTSGTINSGTANITIANGQVHGQKHTLDWSNCYSFGQGVESNRIRDDYNAVIIDKGPIVSTVLNEKYKQEVKLNTITYSGIFNSTGGVNRLNEFIQAEKITKDLNPEYGSIQKLHVRDTDLIALCEDKVLKILANKDALFNADGNTNLTSTNNVLGQAMPFVGEHGISKNPESFVSHAYRVYFSDKARGSVLRLSRDGLTDIAMKGMTDWFNDNLPLSKSIVGSYNERKGSYNITLNGYTLCFDERVDGWTSFKSFLPESGVSLNNTYYTYSNGYLYAHSNERRNSFHQTLAKVTSALSNGTSLSVSTQPSIKNVAIGDYVIGNGIVGDVTVTNISVPYSTVSGVSIPNKASNTTVTLSSAQTITNSTNIEFIKTSDSSVTLLINDEPSVIKEYKTLSYEGTDSKAYTYSGTISVDAAGNALSPNVTIAAGTPLSDLQKYKYNANQIAQLTETAVAGWSGTSVTTNSQSGSVKLFKNKEGLWSNSISGDTTSLSNIDTKELSVQGLGTFSSITGATSTTQGRLTIKINGGVSDDNVDYSDASHIISGVASGTSLSGNPGTMVLTMKPTTGFSIPILDGSGNPIFSMNTGNGVSGISFSQDGVNVKATLTLSGTMPSSDTTRVTTINGAAVANTYTVNGTYDTIEENTTTGSSDGIAYSGSGIYDKKTVADANTDPITYTSVPETVFTKTFTANTNHFFFTKPIAFIEEEDSSSISSYTITTVNPSNSVDTYLVTTATVNGAVSNSASVTLDAGHSGIVAGMAVTGVGLGQNARVSSINTNALTLSSAKTIPDGTTLTFTPTSVTFTVKYVYGINNPKFDKLVFTAKAVEVFDPGISELTSFIGGNKTILSSGESKTMVIQGSTGYADETNPTFTFSNEAQGSGTITWNQPSGTAVATIAFTTYVGTVQSGMSVTGANIPANTSVSYVVVNPTTNATTIHLILPSNSTITTPTGTINFKEFYNSSTQAFQALTYTITLPETGRLSITKVYDSITSTSYYRYFIRAGNPTSLSSSFSGSAEPDSSNNFASFYVNQYEKPTININATSTLVDNQNPGVAINVRNLDSTVTVSSASIGDKAITLASSNSEIKIGMLVTGTNIPAKTRVKSISGTTLTIDQTPTLEPSGELKFLDNGKYEAYGEPNAGSIYSKIPFKVVASVGGTTTLSKQREISLEEDFQYTEIVIAAAGTVYANVYFYSGAVPDSLAVGAIITSDRITTNHSDKIITVGDIPSASAITLAVDGTTLTSGAGNYVLSGDELTFSTPYSWDFSISNLSDAITGSNKIYTLTGLLSVARYGNQNLPIGLNLNNILQAASNAGSGGATTTYIFISKTFSTSYYISSLIMYPKSVAVGTAAGTVITFTGSVIGNWYGNAISGIKLYLGSATGFNDASGGVLTFGEAGDVQASITSTLTFANSSPTTTSGTFTFNLKLAATVAAGQTLSVEPRIYLPIQP